MQIDWITVLAQIANFLVLVWLLQRFLYAPIIQAMARREARIEERLAEAREAREEAEAEAERLRERQREVAASREEVLEDARDEAVELRERLGQELREEIEDKRRAWLEHLEKEQVEFTRDLKIEAARQLVEIVRKVLSDFADADLATEVANEFVRRLETLREEDRERLAHEARRGDNGALVESGVELPPPARGHITRAIHEQIADRIEVEYRTADDVLLGVRLTIGDQTAEWSAGRHLARLEATVAEALEDSAARAAEGG